MTFDLKSKFKSFLNIFLILTFAKRSTTKMLETGKRLVIKMQLIHNCIAIKLYFLPSHLRLMVQVCIDNNFI